MTRIQANNNAAVTPRPEVQQANDPVAQNPQRHADGFEGMRKMGGGVTQGVAEPNVPGSGRVPSVPASVHAQMVELSDPSTLKDMYDLRRRIRALDRLMVAHKDPRGMFTSLYRVITNGAVDSVEKGIYQDNEWGAKLTHEFGR